MLGKEEGVSLRWVQSLEEVVLRMMAFIDGQEFTGRMETQESAELLGEGAGQPSLPCRWMDGPLVENCLGS